MAMVQIAQRLTECRIDRRLSQAALAYAIGVSERHYRKWESGAALPGVRWLEKIAAILGIPMITLFEPLGTQVPQRRHRANGPPPGAMAGHDRERSDKPNT